MLCIDGFGGTEIERQLGDDLPTETEVETTTETVGGRDRIGVEHIVLVEVDAVGPFAGIEGLRTNSYGKWNRRKRIGYILGEAYSVTLYIIGIGSGAEGPTVALPVEHGAQRVGGGAFLFGSCTEGDPPFFADVLGFEHGIVAEGAGVVAQAVLIALEIEDIAITEETPMVEAGDVEAEVAAVLVIDARGLGESIAELVIKPRGVITIEGE